MTDEGYTDTRKMTRARRRQIKDFLEQVQNDPAGPTTKGPWTNDGSYEFSGEGSIEHQVKLTVFELVFVYEYWAKITRHLDIEEAYYGISGGFRLLQHSASRREYLRQFIGNDTAAAIWNDLYKDFDPPAEPYGWMEFFALERFWWKVKSGLRQALTWFESRFGTPEESTEGITDVCYMCGKRERLGRIEGWYSVSENRHLLEVRRESDEIPNEPQFPLCEQCKQQLARFCANAKRLGMEVDEPLKDLDRLLDAGELFADLRSG